MGNKDNLDTISTGSNTTTSMRTTTANENNTAFDAPVTDAVCFNQHYPVPSLSPRQQHRLYRDYSMAFDLIKEPSNELSEDGVTFDRITSMFLRMCFHDNAIDTTQQDFR